MRRMREDAARPLDRKTKVYRAKYFTIISTTACSLELAFSIDSCKVLAYENPQPVGILSAVVCDCAVKVWLWRNWRLREGVLT
jgi:hypothetical protein